MAPSTVAVMNAARLPPPEAAIMIGDGQGLVSRQSFADRHCLIASSMAIRLGAPVRSTQRTS